jgi:hypothetical protein
MTQAILTADAPKPKKKNFREKAFENILKKSLSLQRGCEKPLTVIYDEHFFDMFDSLITVLNDWKLPTTFIFIPMSYQSMMMDNQSFYNANNEIDLPPQILGALNNSSLILSFLNGDPKYSKIRGAIISLQKHFDSKMVHSPGISDEVLRLINKSPFDKIHKESELVAWALGNAHQVKVTSTDNLGNKHVLNFTVDGWDNEPFISSGKVLDNSWGNVPPGEAFCCPELSSVNGSICINGSLPGYLLTPVEEVVLHFVDGRLMNWVSKGQKAEKFLTDLKQLSIKHKDSNWNCFAEFGIGLNYAITQLVGKSLFDEKMGGTIHIALGDNTSFGHGINSFFHNDLVCIGPKVELDGIKVLQNGVLNILAIKKRKKNIKYEGISLEDEDTITLHPNRLHMGTKYISRVLSKGDRKGIILILNGKHVKTSQKFVKLLPDNEIKYSDLRRKFKPAEIVQLKELLSAFNHYRIINVWKHEN